MDSGLILILAVTLMFAWLDDGFGQLVVASLIGLWVYWTFVGALHRPGLFTRITNAIYARKKRDIGREVAKVTDPEKRKRLEHMVKKKMEKLIAIKEVKDEPWIRRTAALFFFAALACPWMIGAGMVLFYMSLNDELVKACRRLGTWAKNMVGEKKKEKRGPSSPHVSDGN